MQRFLPRKLDYRGTKQNPSLSNLGEGFINWVYIVHGVIKHWILKDYPDLPVGTCLFLRYNSHFFAEWRAWTE